MKKKEVARSRIRLRFINTLKKGDKQVLANIKRVGLAFVFVAFILPLNGQIVADKKIKPGKKQATLILSNGKKIMLKSSSDTIVNSQTTGVQIKIDSCGINYITPDNKKGLDQPKKKIVTKKKNNSK